MNQLHCLLNTLLENSIVYCWICLFSIHWKWNRFDRTSRVLFHSIRNQIFISMFANCQNAGLNWMKIVSFLSIQKILKIPLDKHQIECKMLFPWTATSFLPSKFIDFTKGKHHVEFHWVFASLFSREFHLKREYCVWNFIETIS